MTKTEFGSHLRIAAQICWELSQRYLLTPSPTDLVFHFTAARRSPESEGCIKYLGGRLLKPSQLVFLSVERVGQLLWIDTRVPRWVNLSFMGFDESHSFIEVTSSSSLYSDDTCLLYRGTGIAPFHVLGPPLTSSWQPGQRIHLTMDVWPQAIRDADTLGE